MKRLLHDVPRWHLYLHRDARGLSAATPEDTALRCLEDELFDRLFSGECELLPPAQQDAKHGPWAKQLHAACEQLPAFARLADQCRGDALAAATAVESLFQDLNPRPPTPQEASGVPPRRRMAQACEKAALAVEELHDAQTGFEHVDFAIPGTRPGTATNTTDAGSTNLARRLSRDERLRRIALLAGRFKRILASKRRERVRHGADELSDVEQGADTSRLLPVELARLSHPRQRLAFLRDFTERRCLQYQLRGNEHLGKGPLVACLDKSSSMDGARDVWATAVALALLDVAQRERRPFALLCFDTDVRYRAVVPAGGQLPQDGLFVGCDGGTDIGFALSQGLDVIADRSSRRLRKADLVLVTDGESDTGTASEVRARAAALGVTTLGFGIGIHSAALTPWCDEAVAIQSLTALEAGAADALASL